ncbi:MAG: glycosyltransferase [Rhizomicrobium sp.]
MNPFALLAAAAGIWWACSVAVLLLSFAAALSHPVRRKQNAAGSGRAPLSVVVPVSFFHPGFEDAQRSLFSQDYEGLEIILSARETESAALVAAQRIRKEFPGVASRLVQSDFDEAASPKLNAMWQGICDARNDLILTKDSNLCLEPGEIADLVRYLDPETGLVSTIPIATNPQSFAAWVESSIINCYHARVLMLADSAGLGFGLGKVMLFRRSDLMRAGGLECLAWALGEDMALAQAMGRIGLRTVLADCVSHQYLGRRSFSGLWQRQLRWMVIWRVQLPAAFIADILGSAIPTAAAGAAAATLFGFPPEIVAVCTVAAWFFAESVLCAAKGWPISLWSPLAFLGREVLTPILWLRACTTSEVRWAGAVHKAARRPRINSGTGHSAGPGFTRNFDR